MSKGANKKSADYYFNEDMRHRLVQDFVVGLYNRKFTLDFRHYGEEPIWTSGTENLDGGAQVIRETAKALAEEKGWKFWTFSRSVANGTLTVTRHVDYYRDVVELCDKYSGRKEVPDTELPLIEKRLYKRILSLMRTKRVKGEFQMQPYRDAELGNITDGIERCVRLIDNLEKRTRSLENLAGKIPR